MADDNCDRPTVEGARTIVRAFVAEFPSTSPVAAETLRRVITRLLDWTWICEFCCMRAYTKALPASWDLVWQSAVCPDCQRRVRDCGGYAVVRGGLFAEVPDPRAPSTVGSGPSVAAARDPQGASGPTS